MAIHFSELRSPEIEDAAKQGAAVVLPFGQTEEHGKHLPVQTDTLIVQHVCEEAVKSLDGQPLSYVMDPLCYGYSQEVLTKWPGTFYVPQDIVIQLLKHVLLSLVDMEFRKIVVVSGHGNHTGVARVVARMLADEAGVGPGIFFPHAALGEVLKEHGKAGPGGSCHGGEFETSVMLHLAPELVDMSAATADDKLQSVSPYPSSQAFVSTWTRQESRSGIYGDPTVATPELGKILFENMVEETANFIRYYHQLKQV